MSNRKFEMLWKEFIYQLKEMDFDLITINSQVKEGLKQAVEKFFILPREDEGTPEDKFFEIYALLPSKARRELIYGFEEPRSLRIIEQEISHGTPLGKILLEELGFE